MRILSVTTGVMLLLTGVWCFANPGAIFLVVAFVLGWVMVLMGISGGYVYIKGDKFLRPERRDLLGESTVSIILGLVILLNLLAVDMAVSFAFGLWILYSGINRITAFITAFLLKSKKDIYARWNLGIGIMSAALGIYCFFNSVAFDIPEVVLVGITFLVQGVNRLAFGIAMPAKKHRRISWAKMMPAKGDS